MAIDAFLKLDGVDGESTDEKHKKEIEIQALSWGVSNASGVGSGSGGGGVAKGVFSDFSFTKKVDLSSPKLALYAASGEHIKSGVITIRKAGGHKQGGVDYQVYDLEKIYVTGIQISGSADGEFYESLSLSATKIKWKYQQQGEDGSLKGNTSFFYDRATNKGG